MKSRLALFITDWSRLLDPRSVRLAREREEFLLKLLQCGVPRSRAASLYETGCELASTILVGDSGTRRIHAAIVQIVAVGRFRREEQFALQALGLSRASLDRLECEIFSRNLRVF